MEGCVGLREDGIDIRGLRWIGRLEGWNWLGEVGMGWKRLEWVRRFWEGLEGWDGLEGIRMG